ncbi:cytochrome P450 [Streptomyces flavidovirens]|uniref:cytochrome P450 n=1 Tax=Streptomyces flavidovirens TaxID=67298 RepID=UPI00040E9219|nr:cytochrome P450 [Streptomyces flavidovirens]
MTTEAADATDRLVTAFDHHDPGYTPQTAERVNSEIREQGVTWSPAYGGIWILSRYADVRAALTDWRTYSSARGVHFPRAEGMPMFSPIDYDPPQQREIRDRMAGPMTGDAVGAMVPELRRIVARLLAPVVERGHGDLMAEFAEPFAIEVLGVAFGLSETCRSRVREATRTMWTYISTDRDASKFWPAFHALLAEEMDRVRRRPDGSYLARLAAMRRDGRPLPDEELYSIIVSFCVAGHDNTMNSITRLVHTLAGDPALQRRLRREPRLRPAVAEEALRRWCPTDRFTRVTTREVTVAGTVIPAGARVVLLFDAANRDPEKFPEPDEFNPDRGNSHQHLSFGHGIHHCMGVHLARAEFAAVLDELAQQPLFDLDEPSELHFENGRHIMFDRVSVRFRTGEER